MSADAEQPGVRRADTREVLRKLHTGGAGCLATGGTGSGKTTLLDEVARILALDPEGGFVIVRAALPAALRGVPAGIVTYLLPDDIPEPELPSPVALLSACRRQLQQLAGRRQTLLVLDDLQHADDISLWLVLQLASAPDVLLLGAYNTDTPLADDLQDLADDGLLQLHPLRHLEPTQSVRLVSEVLGGEVSLGLAAEIHTLGQGNPALMRAVLEQSLAAGAVAYRDDVWVRISPLHPSGSGLRDFVLSRLDRRTPSERRAMEILALAEPLPLSVMEQLVPPGAMAALEEAAVIEVREDRLRLVSLALSGEAEVLRQLTPAERSVELRREVLAHAADAVQDPLWGVLRRVELMLDSGLVVPCAELAQAARAANDLMDGARARRMASAISGPAGQLAVEVEQARALFNERRYRTAFDQLSRAVEEERDPARREFVRAVGVLSHMAPQADVPASEVERLIREAQRRFREAVRQTDCPLADEERQRLDRRLDLLEMMAEARAGRWPDPNQPLLFGPAGRPVRKVEAALLHSVVAEALCVAGRFTEAAEMSALAVAGIVRIPGAMLEDVIALVNSYAVVLALAGRWDQPNDVALQRSGVRSDGAVGPWMLPPSLLQEPDSTKGIVPRTRRAERGRWVHNYGGQIQLFRGVVLGRQGQWAAALPQLQAAASQLTATSEAAFSPLALAATAFAAWRTGSVTVAIAALRRFDAAQRFDSVLVGTMADFFADVARAGLQASPGPGVPGGRAAAIEVLRGFAAGASMPAVQGLARDLLVELEALGPEPVPAVQGLLTVRERSVASLAAGGKPSAQIAVELGIAVNTVNAHLRRVYSKLAVSSRRELARLFLAPNTPPTSPALNREADLQVRGRPGKRGSSREEVGLAGVR